MGLKGDNNEVLVLHQFFLNESATRGAFVSVSTGGSGAAMDQSLSLATVKSNSSGAKPLGILLNDVFTGDLTRQHINFYKNEVAQGGKIAIGRIGHWTTDQIASNSTPSAGDLAYLGSSGVVQNTMSTAGGIVATPKVGQFLSGKDQDGYATVFVSIDSDR